MRLVLISDTHSDHESLIVPDGDVLIHCGDVTGNGSKQHVMGFCTWFGKQPHHHKIFIGGNHDEYLERKKRLIVPQSNYLENSGIEIEGVKFYGSPITPEFNNWYFMRKRGDEISKEWAKIPDDTEVLITHGPPYTILDQPPWPRSQNLGCYDLWDRVKNLHKLKVHCFGHIHNSYGTVNKLDITFVNCSVMNEEYIVVNAPIVIDI